MSVKLIKAEKLAASILAIGKKAATFSEALHNVAYSVIKAVHDRGDQTIHADSLYNAVPMNMKRAIRLYLTAFGRMSFDSKKKAFTFTKTKKSNLESALEIGPMEYERESKAKTPKVGIELTKGVVKSLERNSDIDGLDPRVKAILAGALTQIAALSAPTQAAIKDSIIDKTPLLLSPEGEVKGVAKPAKTHAKKAA